jgi:hypothetical protein
LRERLATVLIIPSSWGSQLGGYPACITPQHLLHINLGLLGKKQLHYIQYFGSKVSAATLPGPLPEGATEEEVYLVIGVKFKSYNGFVVVFYVMYYV